MIGAIDTARLNGHLVTNVRLIGGGGSETKFATYLSALEKSYGKAVTQQPIFDGPAHALILPNLF